MTKKTFKISGMHCAGCVRKIELVLTKTAGIHAASVNFATESALVEFDEQIVSEIDLAKAVESICYRLDVAASETKTLSIKVIGMDSPHCAMIVEGAVKKLDGVKNIDVDFANQRAKIVFDSSVLSIDTVFKVITDAGYKPIKEEVGTEDLLDKEKIEREKQLAA